MNRLFFRSVLALGLVAGGSAAAAPLAAQELPRQGPPKAEQILDREAEALGGKEANQKIKTVVMKMKLSVGDQQAGILVYHAGPTKQYMEVTLEGVWKKETVVNGDLAWEKHSITGARLLRGAEKAQAFKLAADLADEFRRVGNWRQQFKQATCVGEEQVAGKPAYKVLLTRQDGTVWTDHYDKQSGLLLRRESTEDSPEGKVKDITFFSDYRKVDGITHAFKTRMVRGDAEMVITLDQIQHNVDIPEERFALPAELAKRHKQR
jgi:hypothetical protein